MRNDDRDRMVASGVVESADSDGKRQEHRSTMDLSPKEATKVVWRPRKEKPRRRALVPFIAASILAITGIGVAVIMLLYQSSRLPETDNNAEDPLAIYQVATELFEQDEYTAARQMLQRAREVTKHSRAHRQLDALEEKIATAAESATQDKVTPPAKKSTADVARAIARAKAIVRNRTAASSATPKKRATSKRSARARSARRQRSVGKVYVESDAVGDVLVDGRPTGTRTPTTLKLPPGTHAIEVVPLIDPTERMTRRVEVTRGSSTRIRLSLRSAARRRATARTTTPGGQGAPDRQGATSAVASPAMKNDPGEPAIGTVSAGKPAIGLMGGSKPTIGIVKSE